MAKASLTETRRVDYDEDLYAWSLQQAALLRARHAGGLDWQHLAEESQLRAGKIGANSRDASA